MKGMKHLLPLCTMLFGSMVHGQEIKFDQGNWQTKELTSQRIVTTVLANEERVDSVFTEDLATGKLELVIQKYPLARYEYHSGSDPYPPLWRRIDIRQLEIMDTVFVEDIRTGSMEMVVQKLIKDIPNGAYHEFFPNGNIRIKGTLDGYNADGRLKKTGEWKEWDAGGNVIRQETYP